MELANLDWQLILATLVVAASSSFFMEKLKASRWFPWLTKAEQNINRFVTSAVAAFASLGVHVTLDPTFESIGWVAALMAGFASPESFVRTLWNWLVQWGIQELSYRTLVKASAKEPPK